MANSVSHFSHPHPLTMVSMKSAYICDLCKKTGTGNRYRCSSSKCDFDLHERCIANYPYSMHTSLHPEHLLFCLQLDPSKPFYCNHCGEETTGFVYSCRPCNFDLHLDCAVFLRLRSQPSTNEVERSLGGLALGASTGSNSSSRATIVPGGPGLGIPSNSSSQGSAYGRISNNYNPGRGYNNNINGGVNNIIRPGQSAGIPWPGVGGAGGGHVGHGHGRGLGTTLAHSSVGAFGSKMGSAVAGGLIDSVSGHAGDVGHAGDTSDEGGAGHVSDVSHTGDVSYAAGQVSDTGHPSEASYGGYPGYDGHASHIGNVSYVGNGASDAGAVDYAGHAGYANYAGQDGYGSYGGYDGYAGYASGVSHAGYASGVSHAGYANYGGGYADDADDDDSYDF